VKYFYSKAEHLKIVAAGLSGPDIPPVPQTKAVPIVLSRYETTLTGQMSVIDTTTMVPTPSTAHLSQMLLFLTPFSALYTDEILHL